VKGLYIVTPDWDDTQALLGKTEAALRGGAELVQYRHKTATTELRREQSVQLLEICRRFGKPLVINDFPELCIEIGADGVHVGGTDASVSEIRKQLGAGKIVGASCYGDLQLARNARAAGASYVAFGGFYPSRVKKYEVSTSPNIIALSKAEIQLPVVVIGGMTLENSQPLVQRGADMVAAISSVYMADDAENAAREFSALFAA
jgi:thiamine-phosphate pyrophosphorylase